MGPWEPWAYEDNHSVLRYKSTCSSHPSAWCNILEDRHGAVLSYKGCLVRLGHTVIAHRCGLFFFFSCWLGFLFCFGVLSFLFSFLFSVAMFMFMQNILNFSGQSVNFYLLILHRWLFENMLKFGLDFRA